MEKHKPAIAMKFTVESEQEEDGRWLAEVLELPGVLAYGTSRDAAMSAVLALTLRALADQVEHGELTRGRLQQVTFEAA